MNRLRVLISSLSLLLMVGKPVPGAGQDMPLPPKLQLPLLMNTLSFNRTLLGASSREVVVGIVYQSSNRISLWTKNELMHAATNNADLADFAGRVRWVLIDMNSGVDLESVLVEENVQILYIAPLRGVGLADITRITRQSKILTICGIPEYVAKGVSVGTGQKGDRPEILINLMASKAEGATFDSRLLRIARLYGTAE